MALWAVGALINVIGSIMINLGTNIIKLGHTKTAALAEGPPPKLRRQPRLWWHYPGNRVWLAGMSMFSIGNLLNFSSFAFAAQSLLSALGVVQFISNIIFGRFVNKEKVTKRVLIATAVVCTGCVLLVSFGNHESPVYSTHDMLDMYKQPAYITYLCLIFTAAPTMYFVYRTGKRAILADLSGAAARKWARWLPITYALFAGLLGTQGVLYGKTISMLLRTTFSGDSQLGNWYTWISLILFVLFAGFWMSRYSKAMKLFPVLIIMPIIQIVWVLFSMISGSLYFQEYKTLDALSGSMFGVGVVVLLFGVWLLTGGKPPAAQHPPQFKVELSEEEKARAEELDGEALRTKAPLSDNLDTVAAAVGTAAAAVGDGHTQTPVALMLEPEEALVARKLSTVYERRGASMTSAGAGAAGGGGIALGMLAPRQRSGRVDIARPVRAAAAAAAAAAATAFGSPGKAGGGLGPAVTGDGGCASASESETQLMEEGACDSALEVSSWPAGGDRSGGGAGKAMPPLRTVVVGTGAGNQAAAATSPAGAAAAPASSPTPASTLLHEIRSDWGVGVRDCVAVMRASVGMRQDDDETTAFSIWSMPMPASFAAARRRHSTDMPHAHSALLARTTSAGAEPTASGGAASRSTAATTDDLHASSTGAGAGAEWPPRTGYHRRLNRSRSANELDDMLRAAGQMGDHVELAERAVLGPGAPADFLPPDWLSGSGGSGATPSRSALGSTAAAAAAPLPRQHWSPQGSVGRAPMLSTVLSGASGSLASGGGGGGALTPEPAAVAAAPPTALARQGSVSSSQLPALSSAGSAPRRPWSPDAVQGTPMSPTFSLGSHVDESEGPGSTQPPLREGTVSVSEFLAGMSPGSERDLAAWEGRIGRQQKRDKAA